MQNDLFTQPMCGRIAVHERTGIAVILLGAEWDKDVLHYTALVPIRITGQETVFCQGRYAEDKLILTDDHINNYETNQTTPIKKDTASVGNAVAPTASRSSSYAKRGRFQQ